MSCLLNQTNVAVGGSLRFSRCDQAVRRPQSSVFSRRLGQTDSIAMSAVITVFLKNMPVPHEPADGPVSVGSEKNGDPLGSTPGSASLLRLARFART
jgi:hypothetical protein